MPFILKPIRLKSLLAIFAMLCVTFIYRAAIYVPAAGAGLATRPSSRPIEERRFIGTLVKVKGHDLVIHINGRADGVTEFTFHTDRRTNFRLDGNPATLKDLKPGINITIINDSGTRRRHAKLVIAGGSAMLGGTAARVEGNQLILMVSDSNGKAAEVAIMIGRYTHIFLMGHYVKECGKQVWHPSHAMALKEIKPGMKVNVMPKTGVPAAVYVTISSKHP